MALATEYFKTAAAQLRRAAVAKQQEIDEIRRQMENKARETHQKVESLRQEIADRQHLVAEPVPEEKDDRNRDRAQLVREIQHLQGEISQHEHNLMSERDKLQHIISDAQRDMTNIQHQAADLDSKQ